MTGDVLNDFCIQAATVNGSGSQSSNLVITKALHHMGIPVAAKNVFPSNIEGQPTWYDIRVTPQGYQARKRTVDILIAMNPATWERDAANVLATVRALYASPPTSGPAAPSSTKRPSPASAPRIATTSRGTRCPSPVSPARSWKPSPTSASTCRT